MPRGVRATVQLCTNSTCIATALAIEHDAASQVPCCLAPVGHVVTNFHVIKGAQDLRVRLTPLRLGASMPPHDTHARRRCYDGGCAAASHIASLCAAIIAVIAQGSCSPRQPSVTGDGSGWAQAHGAVRAHAHAQVTLAGFNEPLEAKVPGLAPLAAGTTEIENRSIL